LADHPQMLGRIVRIVRWPLGLLLVGAIAWISWYGYAKGFGRRWRGLLEKEFDRYGLSIDVTKLTLDPFHGLIARDVAIFDGKSGDTLLAEINNISLDVNYANSWPDVSKYVKPRANFTVFDSTRAERSSIRKIYPTLF
jgi:hypothetical protein